MMWSYSDNGPCLSFVYLAGCKPKPLCAKNFCLKWIQYPRLPFETGASDHNRVTDETSLYRNPREGRLCLWNETCIWSKTGRSYRQMWKINANGQLNVLLRINICKTPMEPDKASERIFPFIKNFMLHILILFCFLNSFQILPPPPYTPNFIFSLSLKNQKQQRNTHTQKKKWSLICV